MANALNVSGLTLNPKEAPEFSKFVMEQIFTRPELKALHNVIAGVKMKEQIVIAGQFGKTGLKADTSSARKTSGATSVLTQKYWEPAGIEDTIINDQAALNNLFKAYYDKITSYRQKYDITGTDEEIFLGILIEESINCTIPRAIWLADKDVAEIASGDDSGLIDGANVGFYDYFDGLFKQIFAGVTANTIVRYSIAENALTTKAAQTTLAAGRAKTILEAVYQNADSRLRGDVTKQFYVSREIYENYINSLITAGENSTIQYTVDGLPTVTYKGIKVISMENIWDNDLRADFTDGNGAYFLANRVVLSTPANLAVATLNEDDFTELESWFERKDRQYNIGYGFSLDAKVIQEKMISVAY